MKSSTKAATSAGPECVAVPSAPTADLLRVVTGYLDPDLRLTIAVTGHPGSDLGLTEGGDRLSRSRPPVDYSSDRPSRLGPRVN
ncbi:hypothetical protein RRG08_041306 [Elysia crispata]|uniref:Uncharacterized protein n=1 Tax=Elysia crispata TaxID=231223 RepID=A0AAE0ZTV0_9GAST|nr:hypothetical protein RRG08_041306 [Elysia crispata]